MAAGLFAMTGCATAQLTLKDAFKDKFLIGAALNESQFTEQNVAQAALVKKQFNTITPENVMKWEKIHPIPVGLQRHLGDDKQRTLYSIRLTQAKRAVVLREGNYMRFLALPKDHDSTYA